MNNNIIVNDLLSLKTVVNSLKNWIKFYQSNWKILIISLAIGGVIGHFYSRNKPILYKAVLTYAMEEDNTSNGLGGLASTLGIGDKSSSGGGSIFSGQNLTELMKSRLLIEKTLLKSVLFKKDSITLADYYLRINNSELGKEKKIVFPLNSNRIDFSFEQDSLLKEIYLNISDKSTLTIGVQLGQKTKFTSIEVINKNEKFAKLFCESLADEVSSFYIDTKNGRAVKNVQTLQKQADSLKKALSNAVNSFAKSTDNSYNLNPTITSRAVKVPMDKIEIELNHALLSTLVANVQAARLQVLKETPLLQIIDKPTFPLEKIEKPKLLITILSAILLFSFVAMYLAIKRFLN